jgi:RNA polymerase sigma-70 factor (ECF subfamily)
MNHTAAPTIACLNDREAEQMLVAAARHGDEQAFETLFNRYRQKVLRVVLRYTRVREDAEDVVQQSFHKAFMHLCRFEGKSSFSTWLTRIAINEALMFLRSTRAVREVYMDDAGDAERISASLEIPDSRQDPEASYLQRERTRLLLSALKDLRPRMRRALELRELAEFSTEQTAGQMGLSVGAVKARIFHGRRKLRERLRRYMTSPRVFEGGSSRHGGGAARISRGLLTSVVSA